MDVMPLQFYGVFFFNLCGYDDVGTERGPPVGSTNFLVKERLGLGGRHSVRDMLIRSPRQKERNTKHYLWKWRILKFKR
ncbi:hypothetical protein JTE90_028882 [Oedothorax gibbosus]|uniref:Uncharacterized protein n=1 Tax=Oedothorax gibbosus TaxID=931172 RepID=A0AAV6TMW4_9ARAC|nr:hypothetical protein JTE90_028882 [Oedothorax gibbosus]